MDKQQAQAIIKEVFEKSFNRDRFNGFIKNLLNQIEDAPFSYQGNYIPDAYKPFIGRYDRIGKYNDGEKRIDILIVYLDKETSIERARTRQRNFIAGYLDGKYGSDVSKDAALVAFVSPNEEDWRFSLVKMDYRFEQAKDGKVKVKEEFTPARRWSFLVGKNESSHTAQSRLVPRLADDEHNPTLAQMEEAFNIEKVTKEFFEKYRQLFLWVKETLDKIVEQDTKIKADFEAKGVNTVDFAKKLLGQIVFLYFLQKKGWFGVERDAEWGTGTKQFLRELFQGKHGKYGNFFNDLLEPLFYDALSRDRSDIDHWNDQFRCKIPFLNGGLFDPIGNYSWYNTDILLSSEMFSNESKTKEGDPGNGILDIFDRYNFTVKEDEPLEKEVAVDPEMLGKVFENLLEVKDRKSKGTYYTPREIVHYMCQQSLINYLNTELNKGVTLYQNMGDIQTNAFGNETKVGQLDLTVKHKSGPQITKEDIETLIKYGEQFGENEATVEARGKETDTYSYKLSENIRKNAKLIDEKLANIKVCDPAIGSGAFPVGMMHEIVKTRNVLSAYINDPDRTIYHFKRECIEKSLYGVDIDPGAVEIAKLRLWLSLLVDEEDIKQIKPLPNLDYKIVCGNSLLGVEKNLFNNQLFTELERLKPLYFNETNPIKKQEYKQQIDELITQITNGHKEFDFEVYFSEVFHEKGGFDVVIANPPYVRADRSDIKQQRESIRKSKAYKTLWEKWDLYVAFIEKGYNIVTSKGVLEFIIPDAYMASKYAIKSHDFFLKNSTINRIDFCSELKIFDAAVRNIIIEYKKEKNSNHIPLRIKHVGEWNNIVVLSSKKQSEMAGNTFKLESEDKIIGNLSNTLTWNEICYVSVGMVLNAHENIAKGEFKKENLISDQKDKVHSREYIEAKWMQKYHIRKKKYLEWATDRVPQKIRRPTFPELYIPEKIMMGGMTGAIYDNTGLLCNHSITVSVLWKDLGKVRNRSIEGSIKKDFRIKDLYAFRNKLEENSQLFDLKYLLAIINSKLAFKFLDSVRRSQIGFYPDDLKRLPIKKISESQQGPFVDLVDRILVITKDDDYLQNPQKQSQVNALEREVDQMVYQLYGLTEEEIRTVEGDK